MPGLPAAKFTPEGGAAAFGGFCTPGSAKFVDDDESSPAGIPLGTCELECRQGPPSVGYFDVDRPIVDLDIECKRGSGVDHRVGCEFTDHKTGGLESLRFNAGFAQQVDREMTRCPGSVRS